MKFFKLTREEVSHYLNQTEQDLLIRATEQLLDLHYETPVRALRFGEYTQPTDRWMNMNGSLVLEGDLAPGLVKERQFPAIRFQERLIE